MSLFEDASLIITPNGRKAGKLFSLKPFNGSGDLTVVRATTKTEVNASGVIVDVPINVPSFDYTNGSCPSILVEPQRTNLVFPSATATTQSRTVTAVAHTLSFYGTGSIALSGVATGTLVGTGASNRVTLTFTPTAGSLTLTVTGSVTNWQLEAGSNATSLIKTTVSAVTRNADVISKTGISDLIGQTEGTIFAEIQFPTIPSTISAISLNSGNSLNRIILYASGGVDAIKLAVFNGGSLTVNIQKTLSNQSILNNNKIAIKYSANNWQLWFNGLKIAENLIAGTFAENTLNTLSFSDYSNTTPFFGKVKGLSLWKTALTDTQLSQLTTP